MYYPIKQKKEMGKILGKMDKKRQGEYTIPAGDHLTNAEHPKL